MNDHEDFVLSTINTALQRVGLKPLRHVNDSTNGGEWHGQCIKCSRESGNGGDDRFRVNPARPIEDESGTRKDPIFTCRQCNREDKPDACWSGDLVEFVRYAYSWSYSDARTFLKLPPKTTIDHFIGYTNNDTGTPKLSPSKAWQERAAKFVKAAQGALLLDKDGEIALRYLKEKRGFTDDTIYGAQLGYHYPNTMEEGKLWGLEGLVNLPIGIVIPSWWNSNLMGISIRIPDYYVERNYMKTGVKAKYNTVKGSVPCLYGTEWIGYYPPGTPLIICEGQFDALSVFQASYPNLAVFATGSAQNNQDSLYVQLIKNIGFDPVLLAFDNDEAGQKATRFWLNTLNNGDDLALHAYPTLFQEHDINDMLVSGKDIYCWIHNELARIERMRGLVKQFTLPPVKIYKEVLANTETPQIAVVEASEPIVEEVLLTMPEETPLENIEITSVEVVENPPVETQKIYEVQTVQTDALPELTPDPDVELIETITDLQDFTGKISEIYNEEFIVLDLETTGLDPRTGKIVSIMLGTAEWVQVIDVRSMYDTSVPYRFENFCSALQHMFTLFGPEVTWIGHNIKFDMNWLEVQCGIKLRKVYDTMIADRVLYAGIENEFGLREVAERYGLSVSKEERSWFIDLDQRSEEWSNYFPVEQVNYMAQDIKIPYAVWEMQHSKINEQNLRDVVDLEHSALPAFSAMEVHGVSIDLERWKSIITTVEKKKVELDTQLQEILGKAYLEYRETLPIALTKTGKPRKVKEITAINLGSHTQLKTTFEWLGIHLESTDKDALIAHKDEHECIPMLLEWKQRQKFLTSFGEKFLEMVGNDGRIHANFSQLGTVTGRVSCWGPNLQQIPKNTNEELDIRACFVAPEGYKLAIADLSNIELRILADQSGDTTMLDMFARGVDLHSTTARKMFNLPDDVDPAEYLINGKPARFIAKTINFGLAYGLQATGLAKKVDVSEEQASAFIEQYFAMFPGVKVYLDRLAVQALNRGYSMTVMGRRRNYEGTRAQRFGPFRGEIERAAKNHPIQGTNADILKISLAMLYALLPNDCHLVLTVHDEIVIEFPEDKSEEVIQIMQHCMEGACKQLLHVVTIPQQKVAISQHWEK